MQISYQGAWASLAAALLLTGCGAGSPPSAMGGLPSSLDYSPRRLTLPRPPTGNPIGKNLLYVGDTADQDIAVFKATKKNPTQIGEITQGVAGPYDMALSKSGTLFVPNNGNNTVTEYPAGKGAPSVTITDGIAEPVSLTLDSAGTLYVSNYQGNSITVYPKGKTSPSETITSGLFKNIHGLAVDASDNLYVADYTAGTVFEIPKGSSQPEALDLNVSFPVDLAFDSHGNLYVSNPSANDVEVFAPGDSNPSLVLTDGMNVPYAITIGPNDMLFVSNSYTNPPDVIAFKYGKTTVWETIDFSAGPTGLVAKRV